MDIEDQLHWAALQAEGYGEGKLGGANDKVVSRFVWGTVVTGDPLAVRLDGEDEALEISPDSLVKPLQAGWRVWVQIMGTYVIVLGVNSTPTVNALNAMSTRLTAQSEQLNTALEVTDLAAQDAQDAKALAETTQDTLATLEPQMFSLASTVEALTSDVGTLMEALPQLTSGNNSIHAVTEPTMAAGDGLSAGDSWWEHEGTIAGPVIGLWMWNGSGWQAVQFGPDVIEDLPAEKITDGQLSGVGIANPAPGAVPRVEIAGGEFRAVETPPVGESFTPISFGGATPDHALLGDGMGGFLGGIGIEGDAAVRALAVGSLSVGGQDLTQLLRGLPRGIVACHTVTAGSALTQVRASTKETGVVEIGFAVEPGRVYSVTWEGPVAGDGTTDLRLRYTSANGTDRAPQVTTAATQVVQESYPTGHARLVGFLRPGFAGEVRVLLTMTAGTGQSYLSGAGQLVAEDRGAHAGALDGSVNFGGVTPAVVPTALQGATAPVAARRSYESEWAASWTASWPVAGGDLVQGVQADGTQGYAMAGFTAGAEVGEVGSTVAQALTGAVVESIEVFLVNRFFATLSRGTALVGRHGFTSAPSTPQITGGDAFQSSEWVYGAGRWVVLPRSWYAGFAAGTLSGVTLGEGVSESPEFLGVFDGRADHVRLRARYTR